MNLAIRDVSYYRFKFLSSTIGVSLLIMVVVAIGGIVRGVSPILRPSLRIRAPVFGSYKLMGRTRGAERWVRSWRSPGCPNSSITPSR